MDESLRWLVSNNKFDKAEEIIKRICRKNKTDFMKSKLAFYEEIEKVKNPRINKDKIVIMKFPAVIELHELKPDQENTVPDPASNEDNDATEKHPLMNNGTNEPADSTKEGAEGTEQATDTTMIAKEPVRYTVIDIFKHFDVLKITLILCYIW